MNLLTLHTQAEHAEFLANYCPGGDVFAGKSNQETNLYKLILGLSGVHRIAEENIELTFQEYDLRSTVGFLEMWESALGIPDSCFKATGSIADRRRDVNVKFLSDTVVTDQDFVDVAALFGITVTVQSGFDAVTFPMTFPLELVGAIVPRFTMFVEFSVLEPVLFPLEFPIPFGEDVIGTLKCLFRKLAPANVDVKFKQV